MLFPLAVTKDFVAVTDLLTLKFEHSRCGYPRFTPKTVPLTVRYQCESSRLKEVGFRHGFAEIKPSLALGNHVKPKVVGYRRYACAPAPSQLGSAIKDTIHAEKMEGFAERVCWRRPPRFVCGLHVHVVEYNGW
jgi:hypothetical protein